MITRRQFMALGVVAGGAVQTALPFTGVFKAAASRSRAAAVSPFTVRMPVPSVLRPVARRPDADVYQLSLCSAQVEILPGVLTEVLSYGGSYVGPTIKAKSGRRVLVEYSNQLPMAANAHLHGGHVAQTSDGYPTFLIQSGQKQLYEYRNQQQGATLWYHDHTHMMEAEHVYRGMHGFYLLEDDDEWKLNLPSGQYDVPIMLSDAHFDQDGSLIYAMADAPNRTTILANGRPCPYFPVAARKYRFRLLNASTWRFFRLTLSDGRDMIQIGSDGGLLPAPVHRTDVLISPGERVELVLDFANDPLGTQIVFNDLDGAGPVLRFDVAQKAADSSHVPDVLRPLPALPPATVEREFLLTTDPSVPAGLINGKTFDPNRVDTQITYGTTEIWKITNGDTNVGPPGGLHHNFHSHLVQFRVLDRDGGPPLPGESGLKDTVVVEPGKSVRLQATFGGFVGRFPYHCHIIEHSAMGMMGQMEIVS